MKKFMLVAIAAIFALAFSTFTAPKVDDQAYYYNSMEQLVPVPEGTIVCPQGNDTQCRTTVDEEENVPLFLITGLESKKN